LAAEVHELHKLPQGMSTHFQFAAEVLEGVDQVKPSHITKDTSCKHNLFRIGGGRGWAPGNTAWHYGVVLKTVQCKKSMNTLQAD
jgi:hypothetical protein